ncbi:MAG: valine--tRNA ligase [Actinobacteria bacterium]|uniref:valine--tRNA ligase n=1 Tax=freshwater metagenome TaxID=449393 RepID=A0A6J7I505_9ZZZZ|nr:valine--tRNA ligase [Actinomycetota bacterium]MSX25338.1 valine--tRNA ligase [Actinomycetota bacterium]MSY46044.1 valine--tRNA ligase [Actinomycetota bacterium]MSY57318.1 valine--tRNA ligase [Actinomycetota bacterium]MTB00730.1 valine--tRNA ligase [Actinomycetota bacterium]
MSELPAAFIPADIEAPLYEKWVAAGYFTADASSAKPAFTIVLPPPNVTGSLHIGHALDHTMQDAITRMKRMQGFEVLWLPGMDHAGIATQNVVEKQLAAQGLSRHDLGREEFIKKVWEWKAESGGAILGQMRRLGDGVDWSREAFTMDENLSAAVLTIFKKLHDAGLIYRAERIINWCTRCLTALSDIEVEHSDDAGELVSIRYGDGEHSIVVATTRVETMLGDTAVAVHPEDERYKHLIGKSIFVPLVNREIPIVADEHVDPEFGTGAVKVTPAHDVNDFEIGERHHLPSVVILTPEGLITNTGTEFDGLDRFEARKAVVAALHAQGRIVAEKRPYIHAVGHCSRCATTVEPRLSKQWFVKVAPLAQAAADAVRDGRVKIEPEELAPRYFDWVDNMHDWCISRQLWWGHRIPVWYGPNGETIVVGPGETAPAGYTQDPDVLDTWFSSALWPFSTLGWPENTPDLKKFYPTSVLITGYDILFFWVARMMMFGLFALDGIQPFKTITLHGLVRDQFGKKMSKSRGNVIDPLEFMDKYGADALRFTLARGSNPGKDQAIAEDWIGGSRNFATKLWNASRFAVMNGATFSGPLPAYSSLGAIDRWILSRLNETVREVTDLLEKFEFARACETIYHFAWDDLCDWYLELSKETFASGDAADTQRTLGFVLDQLLRLMHPVMPFITEQLWTSLTGGESLVIAQWPETIEEHRDPQGQKLVGRVQEIITEVRRFRSDQGIKNSLKIPGRFVASADMAAYESALRFVLRIEEPGTDFVPSAKLEIGEVLVELDLSGSVDVVAERARLTKDLAAAQKDRQTAEVKLSNEGFMAKAPEQVVVEIRERLVKTDADIARISTALEQLPNS